MSRTPSPAEPVPPRAAGRASASANADRRPTLRDVAQAAGVSKSLVSLAFTSPDSVSPERLERVLAAADRLGYRPNTVARSLASTRGDFVGILAADLHNPVFADIVDAARAELERANRGSVLLSATSPAPGERARTIDERAISLLRDLRPAAVLIVGTFPDVDRVIAQLETPRCVLASANAPEGTRAAVVSVDNRLGIRLAVEHLRDLGHRDIAFIGGREPGFARERLEAYERAMTELDLGDRIRVEECDFTEPDGCRAATSLLAADSPPSAIVAVNDLAAIGAVAAVRDARGRDAGRPPIAVTGFDDTFIARLGAISLTSVDPDNVAIGETAARALLAGDESGFTSDHSTLVEPRLAVRGTSTPGPFAR